MKVKFRMNEAQRSLKLKSVPIGALYWDSTSHSVGRYFLRNFKLDLKPQVLRVSLSLKIEALRPKVLRMRTMELSWSGICPMLQY